ncbi:hypothetical protein ACFLQX_00055 [Bacteroidota bacterium]
MKKNPLILMLLAGLMTVFFYSCEKDPQYQDESEENIILFEDRTILENISPNYYDNHIYRIELLGNNDELCDLISTISEEGISTDQLNIYGTKKHLFNHSSVCMYSIPNNLNDNKVIVYQYDDVSMVMHAQTIKMSENDVFRMTSTDGKMHYSMRVNDRGEFRNIVTEYNPKFEIFSARVHELSREDRLDERRQLKGKEVAPCCRKEDSWRDCIDCTSSEFRETVVGTIALTLLGMEAYAAIAVSCINANPGAVC